MYVLIRIHDTCAFCTALNSLAALEDLDASLVKQDKNVENAAISQDVHPLPSTFFAPNQIINIIPIMDMIL